MSDAQKFVNALNEAAMPRLGYIKEAGEWKFPVYDWSNHDYNDFKKSGHVERQAKRLGHYCFVPTEQQVVTND